LTTLDINMSERADEPQEASPGGRPESGATVAIGVQASKCLRRSDENWRLAGYFAQMLYLVPRLRMVDLYLHSPIRPHGIVLN
jgi:hypothetical protein